MRSLLLVSPIIAALTLAGCSGDTILPLENGVPSSSSSSVHLDRSVLRTAMGDTARLHVVRSRGGSPSASTVHWRVADPTIAAVEDGLIIPLAPGSTEVVASVGGSTLTAAVTTWGPVEVTSLAIAQDTLQLEVGATLQLDAELRYSSGLVIRVRTSPSWRSLDNRIATIINGQVKGVAAGQTQLVAKMGNIADTVDVTVGPVVTDDSGDTDDPEQPAARPEPVEPGLYLRPELPREYLNTAMPAVTGRSIRVPAGANLQAAIDDAQPGDELVLDAGATYVGTFVLRKKSGEGWIIIRTNGAIPPEGTRVRPADAPSLARLVATRESDRVIQTAAGAHHYRLVGLEITVSPSATRGKTLVELGDGSSAQDALEKVPHDLVLDRVYVHGTSDMDLQRCIALQSGRSAVIDSYVSECHGKGMDTQAIAGWNGPGPFKIVNNYLAGAGENVMFGGADPHINNLTPSDIEFRRNHVHKPLEWKGRWTVKNLFELKHAQRVLIEGNVMENNWVDAQVGFAVNMKALSDNNSAPWTRVMDVTFRNNVIQNSPGGVNILARVAYGTNALMPDEPAQRLLFENNLLTGIGTSSSLGSNGILFQLLGELQDVRLDHNTGDGSKITLSMDGNPQERLSVTNNVFGSTTYGVKGSGTGEGIATLTKYAPGADFTGNVLIGATSKLYPANNDFPISNTNDLLSIASLGPFSAASPGVNKPILDAAIRGVR